MTVKDDNKDEGAKDETVNDAAKTFIAKFEIPEDTSTLTVEKATELHTKVASAFKDIQDRKAGGEALSMADLAIATELHTAATQLASAIKAARTASALDSIDSLDEEDKKDDAKDAKTASEGDEGTDKDPKKDAQGAFEGDPGEGDPKAKEGEDEGSEGDEGDEGEGDDATTASRVYTASANTLGKNAGDVVNYDDLSSMFREKIKGDTQSYVASSSIASDKVVDLSGNAGKNTETVLSIPTPGREKEESRVANQFGYKKEELDESFTAAWGCTPVDVLRELRSCNASGRPLLNQFRQVVTDTLNPLLLSKGTVAAGSTSDRNSGSTDIDPADSATWKTCPAWTCGAQRQVVQNEIISCMTITEQEAFNNSEAVADALETLNRRAEIRGERLLQTQLDTSLSKYTLAANGNGASNITRGIAGLFYNIVQAGNYEDLSGYVVEVDAGLLELLYAEQAGRNYTPDDIRRAANELLDVFGLPVFAAAGGADPTRAAVTMNPPGSAAIALPAPATYAASTWRVRLFNPDNYAVIRNRNNEYTAGAVIDDLDLLRQNRRAMFGRYYEGLADFGQCAGAYVDVTVCLDSNRRLADNDVTCA